VGGLNERRLINFSIAILLVRDKNCERFFIKV